MDSKWNVESLKEHFEKLRQADKEAIALALTAAEKAVAVAEANAEKWRSNANEWRQAMTDREVKFMPRAEFEAYKAGVAEALKVEKERGDRRQGKGEGYAQFIGWILAGITILGFIITNALKIGN